MPDKVLNLPLSGDEIIEIIKQRVEDRMRKDCYLHPAATYNGFSFELNMAMKLKDMTMGKETLIWDKHAEGDVSGETVTVSAEEKYDSGDSPNKTRLEHDLEIPVQTTEGRRTVVRKRKFAKEQAQ